MSRLRFAGAAHSSALIDCGLGTVLAVADPSRRISASDGEAASQALERGPASLWPQARFRASRRPWSAPVLIRRADLRESLSCAPTWGRRALRESCLGAQKRAILCRRRGVGHVVGVLPIRIDRAVAPHPVHDDGKLSAIATTRLLVATLGDLRAPTLERRLALVARQHGARGFVERASDLRIAGLPDAALHVDRRARLPSLGRQAETGGDVARASDAPGVVDLRA